MSFKERETSKAINRANDKLTAMIEIDTKNGKVVNYGGDSSTLTSVEMKAQIELCNTMIAEYNQMLKKADALSNRIDAEEDKLNNMCTKVLAGAVASLDADANEIEQLGGTRKSDRKKPVRKQQPAK